MIKKINIDNKEFKFDVGGSGVKTIEIEGREWNNGDEEAPERMIDFQITENVPKIDGFKGIKVEIYADGKMSEYYHFLMSPIYYHDYNSINFECLIQTMNEDYVRFDDVSDTIYSFGLHTRIEYQDYEFYIVFIRQGLTINNATKYTAKLYYHEADETTMPIGFEY